MSRLRSRFVLGSRSRDPDQPLGVGGRILGTLFFGLFLGAGLFFTVLITREVVVGAETFAWAEHRCEVIASEVVRAASEKPYRPVVQLRTVDGVETTSAALRRDEPSFDSWGEAAHRLEPYTVGETLPCYVSDAGEAVLERGPLGWALAIFFPLIFVAIGGIGLVASWRRERRDAFGRVPLTPLARRAYKQGDGTVMKRVGLVVLALGLVMSWFMSLRPLSNVHAARSWDAGRCVVEHSDVVARRSDDGTTYRVDILYRWDRGLGIERSSRYAFFGGSSSGRSAKADIVLDHPVGAEVDCWVDPVEKNAAVLERGFTPEAWLGLLPLLGIGAGILTFHFGRRRARLHGRLRESARMGKMPFAADDPILETLPRFEFAGGQVELVAGSSRWTRLGGILFAAIFWNGIVSIFVREAWEAYARGRPETFLMIFLVPFVLVGIGLVVGIGHALLALGNARPRLIASSRNPQLGETVRVQWRFEGRTQSLEHVRLVLKGSEQATYQVGTDSRTATDEFHSQTLIDLPRPACAMGGELAFEIPEGSMHSFESSHNEIVWDLEILGEIHRWPDIKETYRLVVLPRPVGLEKERGIQC